MPILCRVCAVYRKADVLSNPGSAANASPLGRSQASGFALFDSSTILYVPRLRRSMISRRKNTWAILQKPFAAGPLGRGVLDFPPRPVHVEYFEAERWHFTPADKSMSQPEKHPYDRSSKWLIQHHGDSMLGLAQIHDIDDWRPAQAEVVQPRQLPDGLLEARLRGETEYDNFLLEVATYADRRTKEQLTRDAMLVYLDRGVLPEVVVLVLAPKGRQRVSSGRRLRSRRGLTSVSIMWRVVELWKVPAEELLKSGDVGLVPWVMLADSSEPPATLAQRCRDAIDQHAPVGERENLLAVVQVLTRLRYNDPEVFAILGGKQIMIESPLIDEIVSEAVSKAESKGRHETIIEVLRVRFGDVPTELENRIRSVLDKDALTQMTRNAAACKDLETLQKALA